MKRSASPCESDRERPPLVDALYEYRDQWPSSRVRSSRMPAKCTDELSGRGSALLNDILIAQQDAVSRRREAADCGAPYTPPPLPRSRLDMLCWNGDLLNRVLTLLPTPNLKYLAQCSALWWFLCRAELLKRRAWGFYHPSALLSEQRAVAHTVLDGQAQCTFLTGQAGTGKSVVLRYIVRWCEWRNQLVGQAAPTGQAALQLEGGETFHRYFQLGIDHVFGKTSMVPGRERCQLIRSTWLLIIDEVSMLSSLAMDGMDEALRVVMREPDRVFGGMRLLLCGDFLQLPPINAKFAFHAKCWPVAFPPECCFQLTQSLRQDNLHYQWALSEMRYGRITPFVQHFLAPRCVSESTLQGKKVLSIHTHNGPADVENQKRLEMLPKLTSHVYHARSFGEERALTAACQAPDVLELRVGARVMVLRNLDQDNKVVNGMCGDVVGFMPVASVADSTLPHYGGAGPHCTLANQKLEYKFQASGRQFSAKEYRVDAVPMVRLDTGQTVVIMPITFDIKKTKRQRLKGVVIDDTLPSNMQPATHEEVEYAAAKVQLPLKLAWASSAHKMQGTTVRCECVVRTARAWEHAQVYVMCSRVSCRELLYLPDIAWRNVKAHPEAMAFYRRLFGPPVDPPEDLYRQLFKAAAGDGSASSYVSAVGGL